MGKVDALKGPHEIGKYGDHEEKKNHLGLKIGLGAGISTAIIGGFFGYKALTNDNPKDTAAEVQGALNDPEKKVQMVEKNYGKEAIEDLNSSSNVKYQDEGWLVSGRELTPYSKEDFPKIDESNYKRLLRAVVNYLDQKGDRFPEGEIIVSKIRKLKTKLLILKDGSNPDTLHEVRIQFSSSTLDPYTFSIADDDGDLSVDYLGSRSPWK